MELPLEELSLVGDSSGVGEGPFPMVPAALGLTLVFASRVDRHDIILVLQLTHHEGRA